MQDTVTASVSEDSIEITMTDQGSYDIVLKDGAGNSISSPAIDGSVKGQEAGIDDSDAGREDMPNVDDGTVSNQQLPSSSSQCRDLGMDISGKHLVRSHGLKDPDYVNVKYVLKDHAVHFDHNGLVAEPVDEALEEVSGGAKQLIRIRADEMHIEKSTSDATTMTARRGNAEMTKPVAVVTAAGGQSLKVTGAQRPSKLDRGHPQHKVAPLAGIIEFDLGEGNQLYFDPEHPEASIKEAAAAVAKMRAELTVKAQALAHGPRINVVMPEKRSSGSRPEISAEQLADNLNQLIREKTKMEGQLEVRQLFKQLNICALCVSIYFIFK